MNAVIYARYSSHGQTEQSIEGQLRDCHAWAKQRDINVIAEYVDRAMTGTKDNRPGFQRMISDAARHQFEMVIVWKLDRFARNRYDSAIYKATLKKHGVRVVSAMENITDSPEGIILEGLLESMAEYYSANLSQNIKRGQRENIAKGLYCGGRVPYGYKAVNGKLVADEKTAHFIRYIFEQYAAGVSKREIIDALTEKGMRNTRGRPLSYGSFTIMLRNRAYIGEFIYKGEVVPGLAEPLVDRETFEKVQEKIRQHASAPGAGTAKVDYLLSGKAYCGYCGARMIGICGRSKTGKVYYYYQCGNRNRAGGCKKKNEQKDVIERYVVEQTLKYVLAPKRASRIAKAVVKEYEKEFSDGRIHDLERALSQIDRELDRLIDALVETPKVAHGKIHDRMESLGAQKTDIEADLAGLRAVRRIEITEEEVLAWMQQFADGDLRDEEYLRRIIDVFINSVYLYDDRVIIFYNIHGNQKQVSFLDLTEELEDIEMDSGGSESSSLHHSGPPDERPSRCLGVFMYNKMSCAISRGRI